MHASTSFFATLLSLSTVVLGVAVPNGEFTVGRSPLPGYTVNTGVTIPFARADSNGAVSLTGDLVSIRNQENALIEAGVLAKRDPIDLATLETRDTTHYYCDVGGTAGAFYNEIEDAISYLGGISAACSVPAGPRVCSLLTCQGGGSAIWLCNDKTHSIGPACNSLTGLANDVVSHCGDYLGEGQVRGQEFDDQKGWNVILAGLQSC